MVAASDRTRQFPLAAQGTSACPLAPHLFCRSGRRPPHTHFHFGGDTSDRRRSAGQGSVFGGLTTTSRILAVPPAFHHRHSRPDGSVCLGKVGRSCSQPGRSRGGTVSQESCFVPAGRQLSPENFRLLRLGRLRHLEALSKVSCFRGRPR